tara:strand:+ start:33558 stop:34883 length:1326 start_codon:yes stop_codon:yes gene_type:complete
MKRYLFSHKRFYKSILLISSLSFTILFNQKVFSFPRSAYSLINNGPKEIIDQAWQMIYRDYLDSTGDFNDSKWIELRKDLLSKKYNNQEDSHEAVRAMLSTLGDPYTRFLDPKEFKEMRIDTSGELTGIGIQLSLDIVTDDLIVVSPIEGTPAFKAGISPKDIIISIDGESTKGMNIENAVRLIRGKEGTKVRIGLKRNNKVLDVLLVRQKIEINAVNTKLNFTNSGFAVGYIRLRQFNANASREMKKAILKMEDNKVNGYVLDLRSNPGGLLEGSIEISRQWMNDGIIVSTQTKDGIKDVRRATGSALTKKPLIVLVNEGSASASEVLAGAILDNNRGLLVGEKTFGKGLVQSVRTLSDGSGITVTIAKYLTPNGIDIHKNGIEPNIKVSFPDSESFKLNYLDLGTNKDFQYAVGETELVKLIYKANKKSNFKSKIQIDS